MAPSTHVSKRPYQPSITSYFGQANATPSDQPARLPLSPPLPAETQASLLSVGMRVRKSVPEGYKTHKTLGTTGFSLATPASSATSPLKLSNTRELAPFCGLHKTGGLAAQQGVGYMPPSSAPAAMQHDWTDDEDSLPALSASQNTLASTQNSFLSAPAGTNVAGAGRKRSYDEEVEESMDAFFEELETEGPAITGRVLARPKGMSKRGLVASTGGPALASGGEDFEDASFLAPMDVDGE